MAKYFGGGTTGGGTVTSVFGRIGTILALFGDYVASLIGNDSVNVPGVSVADALDNLEAEIEAIPIFPVDAATTGNIAITGAQNVDGFSPTNGDLIAVWQQTNPNENGIYSYNSAGAWPRESRWNSVAEFASYQGRSFLIQNGTLYTEQIMELTLAPTSVGTTPVHFNITSVGAGVKNDSSVSGTTVKAALNTLLGFVTAAVPNTRTISTTAPLSGGGALSADLTLAVAAVSNTSGGVAPVTGGVAGQALLSTATGSTWATDFQAQNLTTSGSLRATTVTDAIRIGGTVASAGSIRVAHLASCIGRNNANSADRTIFNWGGVTNDVLELGDANNGSTNINGPSAGTGVAIKLGGTSRVLFAGSSLKVTFVLTTIQWDLSVTAPVLQQETTTTNNATGKKLLIQAQDALTGTTVGGALDIRPGNGTTGGLGRCISGGSTQRISWNDTGVGFYATSPVAQQTRAGQLTDSTTGTPSATLVDVGITPTQANVNNNFASLLAKVNALETIIHNLGLST